MMKDQIWPFSRWKLSLALAWALHYYHLLLRDTWKYVKILVQSILCIFYIFVHSWVDHKSVKVMPQPCECVLWRLCLDGRNTHTHTHQGLMGKHHHTWSQRSKPCKQPFLISVTLLFNFLFPPNWKPGGAVFVPPPPSHRTQIFDVTHLLSIEAAICVFRVRF